MARTKQKNDNRRGGLAPDVEEMRASSPRRTLDDLVSGVSGLRTSTIDRDQTIGEILALVGDAYDTERVALYFREANEKTDHDDYFCSQEWSRSSRAIAASTLRITGKQARSVSILLDENRLIPRDETEGKDDPDDFLWEVPDFLMAPVHYGEERPGFLVADRTGTTMEWSDAHRIAFLYVAEGLGRFIEQWNSHELIWRSEEQYRYFVENMNDVVFYLDGGGRITYISPVIETITGLRHGDMTGLLFSDFLHPDDVALFSEMFLSSKGRQDKPLDMSVLDKNGRPHPVRISRRVQTKNDQVTGVIGVLVDITSNLEIEEALKESEQKLRTLFLNSLDAIFIADGQGWFLDFNTSAVRLFGYDEIELATMRLEQLFFNPEDWKRFIEVIRNDGSVTDYEVVLKKKDGSMVMCVGTVSTVLDGEGDVTGYEGIIRDITDKKRLEEQLLQAEKLSSLGEILSGVAHELNNPMTSIIGNVDLLFKKNIPDHMVKKLNVIRKESVRSGKIVQNLLKFARKTGTVSKPTDLNELLKDTISLRTYNLKVDNIHVETRLDTDLPLIMVDPGQIQQVFMNIINNSHDILKKKKGGNITITTSHKVDRVIVKVSDDGPGMSESVKKRVFDPFFTTKEPGRGTGLGMSVSYGIIASHGGNLWVESEEGKGVTFTIELPRGELILPETGQLTPLHHDGVERHVLVIDDEESVLNLCGEILEEYNYRATLVTGGSEGIYQLRKHRFDAVVCDIKMPGLGGREVYDYVVSNIPEMMKKIIFITGDTLGENTQHFLDNTGNRYLFKPMDVDEFLTCLDEVAFL
ncbi:MAG: PAS domain S-box protein [Deltaproteobacteria bacterium]|nr:PAS domain S-box protein [Candidatus Zymogenaceae bacterium]